MKLDGEWVKQLTEFAKFNYYALTTTYHHPVNHILTWSGEFLKCPTEYAHVPFIFIFILANRWQPSWSNKLCGYILQQFVREEEEESGGKIEQSNLN